MNRRSLDRPTRVAFVSDAVWPYNAGGKEKRLHEISRRLVRDGREVHIFTMRWWEGTGTVVHEGVTYHALCRNLPLYHGTRRSMVQAIVFGLATLRLLFHDFDVLDVDHMPFFPLFSARLVCSVKRRPLLATWHEVWGRAYWREYLGAAGLIGYITEALSVRLPDLIVSNSPQTTARLLDLRADLRVETVPLGADFDHIVDVPVSPDRADVMFAGRLLQNKNVDVLLRAVAIVRATHPDIVCHIVGEGPERRPLETLAESLDLAHAVVFHDFFAHHDDLLALLKASRTFVLPSDREGFGIVALEAMACDVPVVTVACPANAARHLIRPGRNGIVTDLDPDALAVGIRTCLDAGPDLAPRRTFEQEFAHLDWSVIAARMATLVDQAAGRPAGPVPDRRPTVAA